MSCVGNMLNKASQSNSRVTEIWFAIFWYSQQDCRDSGQTEATGNNIAEN